MRKNLTISLSSEDWEKVRHIAQSLGETYSGVFHRFIELGTGAVSDSKRVAKYRALLSTDASFLAGRAAILSKARKRSPPAP